MIISIGRSRKAKHWQALDMTMDELVNRLRTPKRTRETVAEYAAMSRDERADAKDVGGFVAGRLSDGARGFDSVLDRQMVSLDADYGDATLAETWELMVGCRAIMHSTHSHTPEKPRLRFLIPLSRPVSAAEYEPIARKLAEMMDIEAFDDTTYQPSRLMYWPSCPADGEYLFRELGESELVNPDDVLKSYTDWRDIREWPVSYRRARAIHRMGEKQGDPLQKPGIIGAFNRVYSITAAIEKFLPEVYAPCGAGRWTYTGGTTTGGAVSYDNDTFLYSHHDSDPTHGRLCSAFDLVRLHLYAHLDSGEETELAQMPSQQRMKELCAGDEDVRAELADAIRCDPEDVFESDDGLERFEDDLTEQGAAKAFADQYGQGLRYNGALGWLFWDGVRWLPNAEAEAKMLMMRYTDMLYAQARIEAQAATTKDASERAKARLRQAVKLRSSGGLGSLVTYSKALLNDNRADMYDSRAWELNTPDGIINLKTGTLQPHMRESKHTKITNACVNYEDDPEAQKLWGDFIKHITGNDVDFARYLQTLAGMAAVGEVYEEGLVISYGAGGNGKSTFWGALRQVLGDYARGINADVLATTNGRTDQSYVAALRGARLVVMGETEEGAKFGVAQMKRLTSRDTISARALYKDPIEFKPTHTTIMHTNHLPRLKSLDGGTLRRIAVAPFPATLPPERVVTNFESVLVRECGGTILKWIVDGAQMFRDAQCKLVKPACVVEATERYTQGEDWLGQFLSECCAEGGSEGVTPLLLAYQSWAKLQGDYVRSRSEFASAMEIRGYERVQSRTGARQWLWLGVHLTDDLQGDL